MSISRIRETLHLRQVEVRGDQAEEARGAPDVAALAAEVSALHDVSNCNCHHELWGMESHAVGLSM